MAAQTGDVGVDAVCWRPFLFDMWLCGRGWRWDVDVVMFWVVDRLKFQGTGWGSRRRERFPVRPEAKNGFSFVAGASDVNDRCSASKRRYLDSTRNFNETLGSIGGRLRIEMET